MSNEGGELCLELESDDDVLLYWEAWAANYLQIAYWRLDVYARNQLDDGEYNEITKTATSVILSNIQKLLETGPRLEQPEAQELGLRAMVCHSVGFDIHEPTGSYIRHVSFVPAMFTKRPYSSGASRHRVRYDISAI